MGTQLQVYLIREPRTLILSSADYALVFKLPTSSRPKHDSDEPAVVVELLPKDEVNWSNAVMVNGRVSGSLGLLNVGHGQSTPSPFLLKSLKVLLASTEAADCPD